MTITQLAKRSLSHYWRLHAAVLAGVAVTAAVLSGSLVVGDSVKESLSARALERISRINWAVVGNDRFFTDGLAASLGADLDAVASGVVQIVGSAADETGGRRANGIQVLGVEEAFWKLGEEGRWGGEAPEGDRFLGVNEALAQRLGLKVGDTLVARVEVPGAISKDAPLSGSTDDTVSIRSEVTHVIPRERMGNYALRNEQVSPLNLFVDRAYLQELLEQEGRINVILLGGSKYETIAEPESWDVRDALARSWTLADASLKLKRIHGDRKWDLTSDRVFLDRSVADAVREIVGPSDGVLTYLVNAIGKGDTAAPYSMVTATESNTQDLLPRDLGEDETVISQWLADDLGLALGDEIELRYFIVLNGRDLREERASFRVAGILPMTHPELNADWTPNFPGVTDQENCRDWEPGMPVDLGAIRDQDETYWDDYKGTPKAFITLGAGRELWGNRFGDLTGIQFLTGRLDEAALEAALREKVTPADFGLHLRDVRGEAKSSVANSFDFGMLFTAMSFFLIVAALILTAMLFTFGVEQRADQIGICLAVGMTKRQVRRVFLIEAFVVSWLGALIGLAGGVIYTKLALWGLGGVWSGAVSGMRFVYHATSSSLVASVAGAVALSMMAVFFASRSLMRVEPRALITGSFVNRIARHKSLVRCVSFWLGLITLLAGVGLVFAPAATSQAKQGLFFGAGALLLIAGICGCVLLWRAMGQRGDRWRGSIRALGRSFALERRGRSLAVIAITASGVFMVTATNSMRLNAQADAESRSSGTGGFRAYGESTLPIYENLNSEKGREEYGLDADAPFSIVPLRVSSGDDASCLNLNRAQKPRLLGVDPELLASREAFDFTAVTGLEEGGESPWRLIESAAGDGSEIPGVIDQNTAVYALQVKLGDVIEYEDARGGTFRVRLVGFLGNSLLQGNVIISEEHFIERFPDSGGFRMFLMDAPDADSAEKSGKSLTRMLEDRGFALTPAADRLNEFNAVQNTYLSIFSTLGGLGVLLGTVGLAVLVGRNVLERRGQLALMRATGYRVGDLQKLVLAEHWFLHAMGVLLGTAAALVAISSQLVERGGGLPIELLILTVGGILFAGLLICWMAARAVVRFPLLESLRSE